MYTFEIACQSCNIPKSVVKVIPPVRNNLLHVGWEPIQITWHDPDGEIPPAVEALYKFLGAFYQFGADTFKGWETTSPKDKIESIASMLTTGILTAHDKIGNPVEEWRLYEMWPHSVNFGELCYSSDPSVDIEITFRFKRCEYKKLSPQD